MCAPRFEPALPLEATIVPVSGAAETTAERGKWDRNDHPIWTVTVVSSTSTDELLRVVPSTTSALFGPVKRTGKRAMEPVCRRLGRAAPVCHHDPVVHRGRAASGLGVVLGCALAPFLGSAIVVGVLDAAGVVRLDDDATFDS